MFPVMYATRTINFQHKKNLIFLRLSYTLSISRSHAFLLRSEELAAGQNSHKQFRSELYPVQ